MNNSPVLKVLNRLQKDDQQIFSLAHELILMRIIAFGQTLQVSNVCLTIPLPVVMDHFAFTEKKSIKIQIYTEN